MTLDINTTKGEGMADGGPAVKERKKAETKAELAERVLELLAGGPATTRDLTDTLLRPGHPTSPVVNAVRLLVKRRKVTIDRWKGRSGATVAIRPGAAAKTPPRSAPVGIPLADLFRPPPVPKKPSAIETTIGVLLDNLDRETAISVIAKMVKS